MVIRHTDCYGQRYVTTIIDTIVGKEITTEVYSPFVAGQELQVRRTKDSIEVYGTITVKSTIVKNGEIIAKGEESHLDWIEVWNRCQTYDNFEFPHHMNSMIFGDSSGYVYEGSSFIDVGSSNNVVWGEISPAGEVQPAGPGEVNLETISVW